MRRWRDRRGRELQSELATRSIDPDGHRRGVEDRDAAVVSGRHQPMRADMALLCDVSARRERSIERPRAGRIQPVEPHILVAAIYDGQHRRRRHGPRGEIGLSQAALGLTERGARYDSIDASGIVNGAGNRIVGRDLHCLRGRRCADCVTLDRLGDIGCWRGGRRSGHRRRDRRARARDRHMVPGQHDRNRERRNRAKSKNPPDVCSRPCLQGRLRLDGVARRRSDRRRKTRLLSSPYQIALGESLCHELRGIIGPRTFSTPPLFRYVVRHSIRMSRLTAPGLASGPPLHTGVRAASRV
jgi:hypothetical protein